MSTRIERLSPEITTLAASIGQEVRYHGGEYFMVPCQRSLWNTRKLGKLTPDGAEEVRQALARMAEQVRPAQALPMAERIDAVATTLLSAGWKPGHFTEVHTTALDRGSLSHWFGTWSVRFSIIGGPDEEVRDFEGKREAAIETVWMQALAAVNLAAEAPTP